MVWLFGYFLIPTAANIHVSFSFFVRLYCLNSVCSTSVQIEAFSMIKVSLFEAALNGRFLAGLQRKYFVCLSESGCQDLIITISPVF